MAVLHVELACGLPDRRLVADVQLERARRAAELGREGAHAVAGAVGEQHLGALGVEPAGHRLADAGARAGDERAAVGETVLAHGAKPPSDRGGRSTAPSDAEATQAR